jgi:hypothetical protein
MTKRFTTVILREVRPKNLSTTLSTNSSPDLVRIRMTKRFSTVILNKALAEVKNLTPNLQHRFFASLRMTELFSLPPEKQKVSSPIKSFNQTEDFQFLIPPFNYQIPSLQYRISSFQSCNLVILYFCNIYATSC